jgi:hypothetical protein
MAIRETRDWNDSSSPGPLVSSISDELLACREEWQDNADAVADAYRRWSKAPRGRERARRFAAYAAALDQEQSAATSYARAAADADRSLGRRSR